MARTYIPSLRLHRPSGLAVVTLGGKDHYLGPRDAPDVEERYNALVARWIAGGRRPLDELGAAHADGTPALTVAGLAERYLEHVRTAYVKRGRPTSYGAQLGRVVAELVAVFGAMPAAKFTRREFVTLRNIWVERPSKHGKPYSRATVNHYAEMARAAFGWGADQGIVPAATWGELKLVRRLEKGRSKARETAPKRAPALGWVRVVQAHCPPVVRTMIDLQLLTGMRPGEACGMRVCDVDRSGPIWRYRVSPEVCKTDHKGGVRVVSLGPQAQAAIGWWVDRAERLRGREGAVFVTRLGAPYRRPTYTGAVRDVCKRLGVADEHRWTPNGLRHFAATAIRSRYGVEAAQAVLGHADVQTTQIYAEVDTSAADRVAAEMG